MGYTTKPVGSSNIFFDVSALYVAGMASYYGMPLTTGKYSKICVLNYPADLPYLVTSIGTKITGATQSGNKYTVPATSGGWASTQYCDGSAVAITVAGTAVAAIATAIY